jgi:hypothetical protein
MSRQKLYRILACLGVVGASVFVAVPLEDCSGTINVIVEPGLQGGYDDPGDDWFDDCYDGTYDDCYDGTYDDQLY